jgi:uncharacterized delta-60 repeat protein
MPLRLSNTGIEIDGTTKLYIQNGEQKSGRILTSGSDGLVRWTEPRALFGPSRQVGELYGGGIVVKVWEEGGDEKILIAALSDYTFEWVNFATGQTTITKAVPWVTSSIRTTSAAAASTYDGPSNTTSIVALQNTASSNERTFNGYMMRNVSTVVGGYSDWYVPSYQEMADIYQCAAILNYKLGEGNFALGSRDTNALYWTSTESTSTAAWLLDLSSTPSFATASKATAARVRYVRQERTVTGNGMIFSLDMTNKKSYNDVVRGNKVSDLVNWGATSSQSMQFQSTNAVGITYSSANDGYLSFFGNQYINFSAPIGSATTLTIEMWAKIPSGYDSRMLFGFDQYDVYTALGHLGFNTNNADLYGITQTQVANLGIIGNWTHYVFEMYSNVSYTNNKIYINGVQQTLTQVLASEKVENRNFNSGNGRIFGWRQSTNYIMLGDLSVFRIYNRSLKQAEITRNYDAYKRKYGIGIPNTHSIQDIALNPATFSVIQNLKIQTTGVKNEKVLRASQQGTATWVDKRYLFNRPDNDLNVGDIYGGGIIVSKWKRPSNVNRYLIMSDSDISASVAWSNVATSTTYPAGGRASNLNIGTGFNSTVLAIKCLSDGKTLVGGEFTAYRTTTFSTDSSKGFFVRLNRDGSLDTTFTCLFNGTVRTIAVQSDGKILVGGDFGSYYASSTSTPVVANRIIRLNSDGTIDTTFWAGQTNGTNFGFVSINADPSGRTNVIEIQTDGKILVGGSFPNSNARYRYSGTDYSLYRIIRLNTDGSVDPTFYRANGIANLDVRAIAVQSDGKILVGGGFTQWTGSVQWTGTPKTNTTDRPYIIRLTPTGILDADFLYPETSGSRVDNDSTYINPFVASIKIQSDGKILIGGYFRGWYTNFNTYLTGGIVRISPTTGAYDTTMRAVTSTTQGTIYSIKILSDQKILIGGVLSGYDSNTASVEGIALINSNGTIDPKTLILTRTPSTPTTYAIDQHLDGLVVAGGDFNTFTTAYETNVSSNRLIGFYPTAVTKSSAISSGQNSDYNGKMNSQYIIGQEGHSTSAAKLCVDYRGGGFSDWYLPSIFELAQAFGSLSSIGYAYGRGMTGSYWSSTQDATFADSALSMSIDTSGLSRTQKRQAKSSANKIRAFREVTQLANYITWNKPNPWDDPDTSWETAPGSESIWKTYSGSSTRGLLFHFSASKIKSYPGAGSLAYNLAASTSNTGTVLSNVTYLTGPGGIAYGSAMRFNGTYSTTTSFTADSYIDFGTAVPAALPSAPYTIEAWFNPTFGAAPNNPGRDIFSVGVIPTYGSNYSGISMTIGRNPINTDTYNLAVSLGDGLGIGSQYRKSITISGYPLLKGVWYHAVCVISSVSPFTAQIYINGVLSTPVTIDGTSTMSSPAWPSGSKTLIGQGSTSKRVFGGAISICRFYNSALTEDEIKQNYEEDRIGFGYFVLGQ